MGREVTMSAEKKAEIDANHADSEGLAPFPAYLCTDQGKQYTAQVFSVTASGKVDVYIPRLCSFGKSPKPEHFGRLRNWLPAYRAN